MIKELWNPSLSLIILDHKAEYFLGGYHKRAGPLPKTHEDIPHTPLFEFLESHTKNCWIVDYVNPYWKNHCFFRQKDHYDPMASKDPADPRLKVRVAAQRGDVFVWIAAGRMTVMWAPKEVAGSSLEGTCETESSSISQSITKNLYCKWWFQKYKSPPIWKKESMFSPAPLFWKKTAVSYRKKVIFQTQKVMSLQERT